MTIPSADGTAPIQHLLEYVKQTAKTPEELQEYYNLEQPEELMFIFDYFLSLNKRRQSGFDGYVPFSFQEINAWKELMKIEVTPQIVEVLCELDNIWLSVYKSKRK